MLCQKMYVVARLSSLHKTPLFIRKFKRQHRATARYPFRDQSPQMSSVRAIIKEPVTNEIDEPVKLIIRENCRLRHERVNAGQDRLNWPLLASQVGGDSCGGGVIIPRR